MLRFDCCRKITTLYNCQQVIPLPHTHNHKASVLAYIQILNICDINECYCNITLLKHKIYRFETTEKQTERQYNCFNTYLYIEGKEIRPWRFKFLSPNTNKSPSLQVYLSSACVLLQVEMNRSFIMSDETL